MIAPRVELRQLAHFVAACQYPTMTEAAGSLGMTPSALSASLRSLEAELDLRLFRRMGSHLAPMPAAFWLFDHALGVLRAEARLGSGTAGRRRLAVRLDLNFTMGRISRAVQSAVAALAEERPEIEVVPVFCEGAAADAPAAGDGAGPATTVEVAYGFEDGLADGAEVVHRDTWIRVRAEGTADASRHPVVLLGMRPALLRAIAAHAEAHDLGGAVARRAGHPADLARLAEDMPEASFLLPESMIADRLGLHRLVRERLEPTLVTPLFARVRGPDAEAGRRFLARLSEALAAEPPAARFRPRLTARQIRYFNLIHETGSVSAAARAGRVTQPSLSAQLGKMEEALGRPLVDRRREGAAATAAGRLVFAETVALEKRLALIARRARDIAAHAQSAVKLGTLPSSGHDSALTARIAEALTAVRLAHPDWPLHVSEATNAALHDGVRAGDLNLAIVGAVQPRMARILLGRSERLSLVAHPSLGLAGRPEISLAEVCALPLVLGTRELSIHQLFKAAAEARHLPVSTVMEAGSLPLAIAMARRAPIATILPRSSVEQDVRDGRLTATPITEDLVPGKLAVIFSPERTLSVAERAVVAALVSAFARPKG